MDKEGNVIDFQARPIQKTPIRDLMETPNTQRQERSPPRQIYTINIKNIPRSQSNPRPREQNWRPMTQRSSERPAKPSLKPISSQQLQQMILQQREKLLKDKENQRLEIILNTPYIAPSSNILDEADIKQASSDHDNSSEEESKSPDSEPKTSNNTQNSLSRHEEPNTPLEAESPAFLTQTRLLANIIESTPS